MDALSAGAGSMARLVTRPLRFTVANKQAWLFVNAEHADRMRFSLLDEAGAALPGLSERDCTGTSAAGGEQLVVGWVGGPTALGAVAGKPVRLSVCFGDAEARLYSFWVASSACGASGGWLAAGGRGFNSTRDLYGICSQRHAAQEKSDDTSHGQ